MYTNTLITVLALASTALAGPIRNFARQEIPCFLIGDTTLPAEVAEIAEELREFVTCSSSTTTVSGVPDVTSNGISFSSISYDTSSLTPLDFALTEFSTASPLASNDLSVFENSLNTYLATEAGIRSVGGNLAIKVPKFFLAFQVARIKTAQGIAITDPGQTVEHLLGKVTKNAASEDADLLAEVKKLATTLE